MTSHSAETLLSEDEGEANDGRGGVARFCHPHQDAIDETAISPRSDETRFVRSSESRGGNPMPTPPKPPLCGSLSNYKRNSASPSPESVAREEGGKTTEAAMSQSS